MRVRYIVGAPVILIFLNCVANSEYYRLLDSAPYISYSSDLTIPLPDRSIALALKGARTISAADPDTSVRIFLIGASLHSNLSRSFGISFNGTSLFNKDHCFYGSIESRYWLGGNNVFIVPALGIGAGSGTVGPLGDIRCTPALFITVKAPTCWYIAPRVALFSYPYRIESGIVPMIDYEMAVIWSVGSGFNIKIWDIKTAENIYRIMLAPEIYFAMVREPNDGSYIRSVSAVVYLSMTLH